MRKKLKIYFTDFWPSFNLSDNYFTQLLNKEYDLELTDNKPDVLFYSVFGIKHQYFNCKRIFFSGENISPDFKNTDFSISFDYERHEGRNIRLPLYALYDDVSKLLKPKNTDEIISQKTNFCNFIYSNPNCETRNKFFKQLSKYKKVDSAGRLYNNVGRPIKDKLKFMSDYKFTIAFENESAKGYTTEKIFEPMLVNSIPIYWGNPHVDKDFNAKSFINYHDFNSMDEVIERIIQVDQSEDIYREYLSQPWFEDNKINEFVDNDKIRVKLANIIEAPITPISTSSKIFSSSPLTRNVTKSKLEITYRIKKLINKIRIFRPYKLKIKINKLLGN
jgi:hypothetical protein